MTPEQKEIRNEKARNYYNENREKIIENRKKNINDNLEKHKEYRKKYYLEHKEHILKQQEEYRTNEPERIKELATKFYNKNKDKIKERQKKYREDNREKLLLYFNKANQITKGDKIECECGKKIYEISLKHHLTTKYHLKKNKL